MYPHTWDLTPKLQFFTMNKMIHPWCFLTSSTYAYICNYFQHKIFQKHFKKLKICGHDQYVLCSVAQLCTILFDPIEWPTRLLCLWGISRQEYWSGLLCPLPGGSSQPRGQSQVFHTAGEVFTVWTTREVQEYWSG